MNVNQQDFKEFLLNIESFCQDKSSNALQTKCRIMERDSFLKGIPHQYRKQEKKDMLKLILEDNKEFLYTIYLGDDDKYIVLKLKFTKNSTIDNIMNNIQVLNKDGTKTMLIILTDDIELLLENAYIIND